MEVLNNVIMTKEIFDAGTSRNGAWSYKQLRLLGVEFGYGKSPLKGWKKDVIGDKYPECVIKEFLELKDKHLKTVLLGNLFDNTLFTYYDKLNLDLDI
jgi:hypothetical protein